MAEYEKAHKESMDNQEKFWGDYAEQFTWHKKWDKVYSGDLNKLDYKWFEGAKLNMSENCLDRHLATKGDKTALIFEANDPKEDVKRYTYKELHHEVNKFANVLKDQGVKKGDIVTFYMGMVPELLIGIVACTRIGAIHSVVFGGFSAVALSDRMIDAESKILITNDGSYRGTKIIPLKETADEAVAKCPTVKSVIVCKRTGNDVNMASGRDVWYHDAYNKAADNCAPESMDSEDPLFILYTSGSTGKPKGQVHTTAGYMNWAKFTFENVFQVEENDMYWCTADIGWVTGHTYITYGPLLSGATTIMFEGVPTWPDAGRFWEVCDKHKVTHFYTAPTAIRALQAQGLEHVTKHSLATLKVLGTVGEPINEEAWEWYYKNIGKEKCPIADTWWQTETGGIMISNLAGVTPHKTSFATRPLPGVEPSLVDADGKEIKGNPADGNLCINRHWPGMTRGIWGDMDRFRQTYFTTYPGKYFTGDGAKRDENGLYRITGRVDDVINVSGHRIGTAEVEDALNQHEKVVESAVVGYPHEIKGAGIYAYVICTEKPADINAFKKELAQLVTKLIGPIARPDKIQMSSGLPKTRSGKIMRRILRKVAEGENDKLGDISTLLNPDVVAEIIEGAKKI